MSNNQDALIDQTIIGTRLISEVNKNIMPWIPAYDKQYEAKEMQWNKNILMPLSSVVTCESH